MFVNGIWYFCADTEEPTFQFLMFEWTNKVCVEEGMLDYLNLIKGILFD